LRSSRELELSFLKEAEDPAQAVEAGVARRGLALSCYLAADLLEARIHCERALEICDPERERQTQGRFQSATGPVVTSVLAVTMWQLGELGRARELIDEANRRGSELGYAPSMVHPLLWKVHLEILRGDPAAALSAAEALERLCRGHGMTFWRTAAEMGAGWARGRLHDAATGAEELSRALSDRIEQGVLAEAWFFKGLLAELEAETLGAESALARVDEAMALAREVETRCNLPFLHLLRGKLLLERDPSNHGPAEEAFQTALGIAREQGARSWGLRVALSLAKLYRSTSRPVEAHDAIAPAIEGFSATPEMPEIAEAQALLATLAQTHEVRTSTTQRQRRLQLYVAYGNALIAARGYGAPETTGVFAKARWSAAGGKLVSEQLAADYGLWVGSYVRGELAAMREHAAAFLDDVAAQPDSPEASVAHRAAGITHWFAGEYREARDCLEHALGLFQPGRDDDLTYRFGQEIGVSAMINLATVLWPLGEVERAISLIESAQERVKGITHAGTLGFVSQQSALFELVRLKRRRVAQNALELARLSRVHDLTMFQAFAVFLEGLAKEEAASGEGLDNMRRGVGLLREQRVLMFDGLLKIALAGAEARAGDPDRAVAILDEALGTSERTGYRAFAAELHRVRGEHLSHRNPLSFAPAEGALQTAVGIARQQGTRAFELRAALSLARHYQSTARPVEAHAFLAPALEGFLPTPEMPEFAEAQALLESLARGGEGAIASKGRAT
jgi:tetratricopeptide (TPR) repeat protein